MIVRARLSKIDITLLEIRLLNPGDIFSGPTCTVKLISLIHSDPYRSNWAAGPGSTDRCWWTRVLVMQDTVPQAPNEEGYTNNVDKGPSPQMQLCPLWLQSAKKKNAGQEGQLRHIQSVSGNDGLRLALWTSEQLFTAENIECSCASTWASMK